MEHAELIQRGEYADEDTSLRLKQLAAIAESAYFSTADPSQVATNAEMLHRAGSEVSGEFLRLEPTHNNQGLRYARWTLNTFKLSQREDGTFADPDRATLRDWEISAADRALARVSLGHWRSTKNTEIYYDENDPVRTYLNSIRNVDLLKNADEEVELAKAIEAGIYAGHKLAGGKANRGEQLSESERRQYAEVAMIGKDAFDHFYEANLGLVVSIAKKFIGHGVPFEDLVQEGNLGLVRAIEKFDYTKDNKFSTYATRWIKRYLQNAIPEQSQAIPYDTYVRDKIENMRSAIKTYKEVHGYEPTVQELAKVMKLRKTTILDLLAHLRSIDSLDRNITKGDDTAPETSLGELILDDDLPVTENFVERTDQYDAMYQILNTLSERNRSIMADIYGLGADGLMTKVRIAEKYGLTRQSISDIETKTLRLMKETLTRPESS